MVSSQPTGVDNVRALKKHLFVNKALKYLSIKELPSEEANQFNHQITRILPIRFLNRPPVHKSMFRNNFSYFGPKLYNVKII